MLMLKARIECNNYVNKPGLAMSMCQLCLSQCHSTGALEYFLQFRQTSMYTIVVILQTIIF